MPVTSGDRRPRVRLLLNKVYRLVLAAMFSGMMFCRFLCVMHGVGMMSTSDVGMMCGCFMLAFFMMFGGLSMVARCVLVVLGRFLVVLCTFVSGHVPVLLIEIFDFAECTPAL
jgi:hypothetical protein